MHIEDFITKYREGRLYITNDISYDLKDVIETNRRLFHSKYKVEQDAAGLNKFFYNIGMILLNSLYNPTDIDTKDVNLRSLHWKYNKVVDLLKIKVKTHLRMKRFGTFINRVRMNMLKDGTCLVKMCGDKPQVVDLLNWIEPAHSMDIQTNGGVEKMLLSYKDLKEKIGDKFEDAKEDIEEMRKKMEKEGVDEFIVYEYWRELEFDGEYHKGCQVYVDGSILDEERGNDKDDWEPYIQIDEYKTPYKTREGDELYPYKKVHMIEVEGRAIGFGVFELVRGLQEHFNELWNVKRKRDRQELAGTYVFKRGGSEGSTLAQSFLNNREVGPVVEIERDEELTKLAVERMTSDILTSADNLFEYAKMVVGANATGVGENLPASMPATTAAIMERKSKTTYDVIIEQMSLFLTEFFEDFYIDVIIDEADKEEWGTLIGEPAELEELDRFYAEQLVYRKLPELMKDPKVAMLINPANEQQFVDAQVQKLVQALNTGDSRWAQIKKNLIKKVPFICEIYVNNESFDRNTQIQNALQLVRDPLFPGSREKLYEKITDLMDLGGQQFQKSPEEEQQEQMQMQMAQQQQQSQQQQLAPPNPIQ